ncbi:hypothetical protein NQ176_g4782 [Zarea fungicola]|uniref:Uncharacterized protein n=1 Tax=Zarea fungicola TaxID=93591 RepID=A0ACC1NBR9_9HYPO|nr:hypothetical protein NQ176_g4782 [Lecanicillium fungicola]
MKAISFLLLGASIPAVLATAQVACVQTSHCKDGNEYVLVGTSVADGSEPSICGSIQSTLKTAIQNNGGSVILRSDDCSTQRQTGDESVMLAFLKMDKQSPTFQSNLLTGAVNTAFGGSGVNYSPCDVSSLPA